MIRTLAFLLTFSLPAFADDFTITINDKSQLVGITLAREAYNTALPEVRNEKGEVVTPKPGLIATDQDYLQMVVSSAATSYAVTHKADVAKIDAEIVGLQTKRAEIVAKGK